VVKSFVLGAITGGALVWFWGPEIREFIDAQTLGLRGAAADRLQTAADTLQAAKETIETGLGGA
jgi:hypothetical protein